MRKQAPTSETARQTITETAPSASPPPPRTPQIATLTPISSLNARRSPGGVSAPAQPVLTPLRALLEEWDQNAVELHELREQGKARGPVTGIAGLDSEIGGALLPGVHIAHGVPGVGKSAFALQIAAQCACPCVYLTVEMPPLELLRRLTARVTSTFLGKFKTGELPPAQSSQLARQAIASAPYLALLDGTTAYATPAALLTAAEATRTLFPENPHLLVVVDSLHSWSAGASSDASEYDRLGEHLTALKQIAARLKAPVLVISERNRQSMERGGLSAGAGHRGIEYGAETVFDLDCDKDAPDHDGETDVTLRLQKNRHGPRGRQISLLFHGALQRFRPAP